jgi:hypothetical protein
MRSSFLAATGQRLTRSPTARQQAQRRWMALIGGFTLLVLAGGLTGALIAPHGPGGPAAVTGPFSYFPS